MTVLINNVGGVNGTAPFAQFGVAGFLSGFSKMITISRIADVLYEEDPMSTKCQEYDDDCEYINEASMIKELIDNGTPICVAVITVLNKQFYVPPKPWSIPKIVFKLSI